MTVEEERRFVQGSAWATAPRQAAAAVSRSCGCGGRECACALRSGREQDSSAEVGRPAKVYRTPAARRVHAGGPPIPSSPPQVQAASGSEGRRPRFACPIPDCNGCYSSAQYLMTHIEGTHLSRPDSVNVVPETFLRAYQRWICHDMLIPWGKSCRSCHAPGPQLSCRRSRPGLLAPTVAEEVPPLAATTLVPANLLNQVDQLFSVKAGTLKHIPVPCRALWAEALTLSLQWLHERKDIEAAWVLVTLPRLVLGPVQRTGKKHNRQVTNVVMRRLHAWFLRDFARLTETALKGPTEKAQKPKAKMREAEDRLPAESPPDLNPQTRRAVLAAVSDGALSKAAKLLCANSPPLDNPEAQLSALHPARPAGVQLPVDLPPCNVEVEPSLIRKLLRSFPPGSSGGPSGLKPVHLLEAVNKNSDAAPLLEALAVFCEEFAQGLFPAETRGWFCGARLIGIPKKPRGIRPIAIGETLRRLAAKALVLQFQESACNQLLPIQLGVSIPQATEIIAHAVQAWYQHPKPDEALLLIDFENAYNSLDRQAMVNAVCADAPEFARYAAFCYGSPVPLVGDGFRIRSEEGTQQGDVCGPLFFSLTLNRVLRECGENEPGYWSRAYLDDVNACGREEKLLHYFDKIVEMAPSIGLRVNLAKCCLWGPNVRLQHPSGIPVVPWNEGVKILGTPVGSDMFVKAQVDLISAKLDACLERLSQLADSYAGFHLLRSCLSACKVTHLLRALPFEQGVSLSSSSKEKTVEAFGALVGAEISLQSWSLACIPVRLGGLGLQDPQRIHPAARISSFVSASAAALQYALPQAEVSHSDLLAVSSLEPACQQLCQPLRNAANVGLPLPGDIANHDLFDSWTQQKTWSLLQDEFHSSILEETLSPRNQKLRELFSGAHAGQWLASPTPQFPTQRWPSAEWQTLLQWRLGLPLGLPEHCTFCGSAQDAYGDHVLCCKAAGVYGRHNVLRDTVADLLRDCGCESRTEVVLPGTALRPADVFTPAFPGDSAMAIDVSVVHPLHLAHNATATVSAGDAAQKREAAKVQQYDDKCSSRAWSFTAFVGETTGAWGQAAQRAVRALARAKSLRTGEDPHGVARSVWDSLSRAVVSSVSRQLVRARAGCGALAQLSGAAPGSSLRLRAPAQEPPCSSSGAVAGPLDGCGPAGGDLLLACALCQ